MDERIFSKNKILKIIKTEKLTAVVDRYKIAPATRTRQQINLEII